jgi:hypothetical protein
MEDTPSQNDTHFRNGFSIIGLLLGIVPIKLLALRFLSLQMFSQNADVPFRGIVRWFDSRFANFGHDLIITAIILILASGSLVTSVIGYGAANKTFKILSAFVIGVTSVIIVLQILMMLSTKTA